MASSTSSHIESRDTTAPIPKKVLDILHGYKATQCLITACELDIFDVLSVQQKTSKSLSQQLSTDENATARLLDVLVSLELLKSHQNDGGERLYTISPFAECLTKESPLDFVKRVKGFHVHERPLFQCLTNSVREGTNRWKQAFNLPGLQLVFEDLYMYHDQEKLLTFLEMMRGFIKPGASTLVSCFDLSPFKEMCDLGGSTGDIAYAACKVYPDMKITMMDLPQVVDCSSRFAPTMDECPNITNVSFVAGDFFEPKLPPADLYVLANIIHDWSEEKIDVLLSNVFNNLPSGGAVLIGESVLHDDKSGSIYAQYLSLITLVACDQGARERSGAEYRELLEKHGFKDVQIKLTGTNIIDAVFAVKP